MARKQRHRPSTQPKEQREPSALTRWFNGVRGSVENYPLLLLVALSQLVTLLISWPVWNVRPTPPLLPLIWFPEISFGIPLVLSLLAIILWPRIAVMIHVALLSLAIVADQHRLQPQVISLAVLMLGCSFQSALYLTRWYLAAMWLWAGLHKWLSPEWYGFQSWWFLEECGFDGDAWHFPFAIMVATFETVLGLLAIFKPKFAVWPAVALHVGLLVLLSPLVRNFNPSVWPWNIATAVVAFWLLRHATVLSVSREQVHWSQKIAAGALLIGPALYYVNLLNPHLAFVLYSGNLPRAIHISQDAYHHLDGWTGLTVPFPDSPRLFIQQFQATAQPGEKLHIADPRWGLPDRYFLMATNQRVQELSHDEFWKVESISGVQAARAMELEDLQLVWRFQQAGYALSPGGFEAIKSAASSRTLARDANPIDPALIACLPNLRDLRWDNLTIDNQALRSLAELRQLEILELNDCQLPADTFQQLANVDSLNWLQIQGGNVSLAGFAQFCNQPKLRVLKLPQTNFNDEGLALIEASSQLTWLELNNTRITSQGVRKLPVLEQCQWLRLGATAIDDAAVQNLPDWPKLEVLDVSRTKITDGAVETLCRLKACQHLNLTSTSVTAAGKARLKQALPALVIQDDDKD